MNNYYVYIWKDPATQLPFYVGKGRARRAFNKHSGQRCYNKLKKILDSGATMSCIVQIIQEGLSEAEAFKQEENLIALYKRIEDGGTLFNYKTSDKGGGGKLIDPNDLNQIIKLYTHERMSAFEIGKIFNLDESTILRRLKISGVTIYPRGSRYKFTEQEIVEMVQAYNKGISARKISIKNKCSIPTILNILRQRGCCIKTKQQIKLEKLNSEFVQTQ